VCLCGEGERKKGRQGSMEINWVSSGECGVGGMGIGGLASLSMLLLDLLRE
jgi:hypothetical protein